MYCKCVYYICNMYVYIIYDIYKFEPSFGVMMFKFEETPYGHTMGLMCAYWLSNHGSSK